MVRDRCNLNWGKLGTVIFLFIGMMLYGCSNNERTPDGFFFKRQLPLPDNWIFEEKVQDQESVCSWSDSLDIDYLYGKVYLIDVKTSQCLHAFLLNGAEVSNVVIRNNVYQYNITNYIHRKDRYNIELIFESSDSVAVGKETNWNILPFEVTLHCLNKFFIGELKLEPKDDDRSGEFDFEVLVKNLNRSERQGQFRYAISDKNDHLLLEGHVPVFVDGNSETIFRKKVRIDRGDVAELDLFIISTLYWGDNVVDILKYPL